MLFPSANTQKQEIHFPEKRIAQWNIELILDEKGNAISLSASLWVGSVVVGKVLSYCSLHSVSIWLTSAILLLFSGSKTVV